jgi:hypothetical protein
MKTFGHLLMVTLFLLISAGTPLAEGLEQGFFDIKWGTNIGDLPQLSKVGENDEVVYCINPKKNYQIQDVVLQYAVFGFYSNRFFSVYVNIDSIEDFSLIRKHLTQEYGDPRMTLETMTDLKIYSWKIKETKIKLKHYRADGRMKLGFYSKTLSSKVNLARQEAFQDAPKSFFPMDERRKKEAMDMYQRNDNVGIGPLGE